ncbi:MAG: DUF6353 family protein [Paenisporosarcina sp.]
MKFAELGGIIRYGVKSNSNVILSVLAGVGTVTTAYLAAKASFKAADVIRNHESANGVIDDPKERFKDHTKLVWKLYIPPAISTVTTVGCIIALNRVGIQRTLAARTLLDASEVALAEYRDKVREELGPRKDQAIRDKVAEDRVKDNPPPSREIMMTGPGNVLCCELFTGRYFVSDMEKLRRYINQINDKLLKHDYATLDDFYHLIGLNSTSNSGRMGWKSDRLLEFEFSVILTEDDRPCIAFAYNYIKDI